MNQQMIYRFFSCHAQRTPVEQNMPLFLRLSIVKIFCSHNLSYFTAAQIGIRKLVKKASNLANPKISMQ